MHPYLIRIPLPWGGTLDIASYGFMIMCGFLLSLYIARKRARRSGIEPTKIFDAAVFLLIGGIVGARLFYVVQDWERMADNPVEMFRIDKGGLVFYGGLIGGGVALLFYTILKKMPLRRTLDVVMSVAPLGHAFGRTGCFLNGCCFGQITRSIFGVRFPRILEEGNVANSLFNVGEKYIAGSPPFVHHLRQGLVDKTAQWSLPVHPTQLYAVVYNLAIFGLVSWWFGRRWRAGDIAWVYAIAYGTARFINEFIRVTEPVFAGLTIAQVICVPLVAFGVVMFVRGRRRPSEPFEPLPEEEEKQAE